MITTYITSTEAGYLYDDAAYGSPEKTQALSISFGLVQGYVNSSLRVPVLPEWNGSDTTISAPPVLKLCQGKFYEYLLRRGEVGDTPEVKEVFDAAVEFARAITQEELTIPEAGTFELEAGWHLVAKSNTGGGDCFVRSASYPSLTEHVKLTITNAASATYPGTFTYTLAQPARQSANVSTGNATSYDWTNIAALADGSRPFEIRWSGKWTNGDYVEITGVAGDMVDAFPPQRDNIQQSRAAY